MTVPSLGPARAFDLAARDLAAIAARLEPMFDEGWRPHAPNPDRPGTTNPDPAGGPIWDCGMGDERVRQGWRRLNRHLAAAEQQATDALCAALGVQSRSVPVSPPRSLDGTIGCVKRLQARVGPLRRLWDEWDGVGDVEHEQAARWLARQLMGERGRPQGSAFDHITQAMYEAQRAIPIVGTGKPPATCTQCRRLGSIGQPRIGGLCYACDQRNRRAGVTRRTTVVVKQRRATLRAAKQR